MAKIIITEEQSKRLASMLKEEVYQMPQNIGDHENKPYSINPDKVKIVKNFLDKNFKKGNYDDIGPDGMPRRTRIVAMIAPTGDVLKNMWQEDLLDLLIDRFKNMFLDHTERELFMKQVMKDWFDDKIGVFGNLSVNRLISENVESEERGVLDSKIKPIEDYIMDEIFDKIGQNEYDFIITVPQEMIEKCYPYMLKPEHIIVAARNYIGGSGVASYDEERKIIFISKAFLKKFGNKYPETISSSLRHELTHLVNFSESFDMIQPFFYTDNEKVDRMLYLFRPTEMTARVNGLYKLIADFPIRVNPDNIKVKGIKAFEEYTSLNEMEQFLNKCDTDENFRKAVINAAKENFLKKTQSINDFKKLYERYKQKIYKAFYDGIEDFKETRLKYMLKLAMLKQNQAQSLKENATYEEVTAEANEADLNPTEKQKEAGNYKMGHISVKGMKIAIENPKGSKRYYGEEDENGNRKFNVMKNHYGYFNVTKGKDGDAVDCFIGPYVEDFDRVYVVDQNTKEGEFDESKVMLGFKSKEGAKEAYLSNYEPGWKGLRTITGVSLKTFKKWLYRGRKQRQPFADYVYIQKKKLDENKNGRP